MKTRYLVAAAMVAALSACDDTPKAGGSASSKSSQDQSSKTDESSRTSSSQQMERRGTRSVSVPAANVILSAINGIDAKGTGPSACKAATTLQQAHKPIPASGAAICLSGLSKEWVAGFTPGWPANVDQFGDARTITRYAAAVTAATVVITQWAHDSGTAMSTASVRDQDEAEEDLRADFTAAAPDLFRRYLDLRHRLEAAKVSPINAGCSYGWTISADAGYRVCGDGGTMAIAIGGQPWSGGGLLAGARIDLALSETSQIRRSRTTDEGLSVSGTKQTTTTQDVNVGH